MNIEGMTITDENFTGVRIRHRVTERTYVIGHISGCNSVKIPSWVNRFIDRERREGVGQCRDCICVIKAMQTGGSCVVGSVAKLIGHRGEHALLIE